MKTRSAENALLGVFAIGTVLFALYPVWRMFFPLEIDRNEAWNAYHVDSVLNGLPLYPSADALIINNYPPLSFYLVAAASLLTGDVVLAGRLISLAGMAGVSVCIFACVSALNGSHRGALLGSLWFIAMIVRPFRQYAAMNDPQLFALFIMGLAFVWFVRRVSAGEAPVAPLVLMVVAGFFKHNLIAMPLTSAVWLWSTQGRAALKPLATAALAAVAGMIICTVCFGASFLHNLLAPRSFSWAHLGYRLGTFQWVGPAIVVCGIGLWLERTKSEARLIGLLLALSTFAYVLQGSSEGIGENAIFEMLVALSIGIGVFLDRLPLLGIVRAPIIILVLLVRLLLAPGIEFAMIIASADYRQKYDIHARAFKEEEARIAAIGSPVSCSVMSVCRGAGKAFVYDDFYVATLIRTGIYTQPDIEAIARKRNIVFEHVDPRTKAASLEVRLSDLRSSR